MVMCLALSPRCSSISPSLGNSVTGSSIFSLLRVPRCSDEEEEILVPFPLRFMVVVGERKKAGLLCLFGLVAYIYKYMLFFQWRGCSAVMQW